MLKFIKIVAQFVHPEYFIRIFEMNSNNKN